MKSAFSRQLRRQFVGEVAILAITFGLGSTAKLHAQQSNPPSTQEQAKIPEIVVTAPKSKPKPKRVARQAPQGATTTVVPANGATPAQQALDTKMSSFDQARSSLLTT